MSRYRADEARVTITPYGSRLLVRWQSEQYFHDILASFRAALPRHGDCCYNGTHRAWSVSPYARDRLVQWLWLMFEPGCIEWDDEEAASASGRGDAGHDAHSQYRQADSGITAVDGAFSVLCLTPQAPDGLVDAAYRWWSKTTHPDLVGGDGQAMVRVNEAVVTIRSHRQRRAS